MNNQKNRSRRQFLKNSGLITIGFSLSAGCHLNGNDRSEITDAYTNHRSDESQVDAWLQILKDGRVLIYTGKMELGQGVRIAIAQVAAEELNTDPSMVEVHLAETGITPDEGYTAGSRSMESSAMSVRYACATAASILLDRGASKLNTTSSELTLENGMVKANRGNKSMTFNKIMDGEQIEEAVREGVKLKSKNNYQWVGKPIPRNDIARMVRGETVYVQDLHFPDMVHARIIRPPGYDRKLEKYDEMMLKEEVDGVLKLVVDGSFMGVIAQEEYQAVRAQQFLERNTIWSDSRKLPGTRSFKEYFKEASSNDEEISKKGRVSFNNISIKASYSRPYTMHGSIGPSCAVAFYDQENLQVWSHTQGVYPLRRSLQEVVGLPVENIRVTGTPGSGCYGHNGADDVAADAAILAKAFPGRHVRLQWSRTDEHAWEPYGSAMVMEFEADLNENGNIEHWKYDIWSDSHSTRPGGDPGRLLPAWYLEKPYTLNSRGYFGGAARNSVPYYNIPNFEIQGHYVKGPLRISALRGLGGYANIFAIECFMDELADSAGIDSLDFRLRHLEDQRAIDVVNKIREMTAQEMPKENEGLGFAFSRYKNQASYIAMAAKVEIDEKGNPLLKKMWAAIDSGEVINPDGLKNQTEGGMLQSASWMLKEQVRFDEEQVSSLDWYGYPILRMEEVPEVYVEVIDRPEEPPLGAGEAAQGPASAAIANAIYRASGKRIRDLPVSDHLSS